MELYDLVADPLENNDLKGKHPEAIKELAMMLEKWQATLPAKPTGSVFSNLRSGKK